jgi:hypothetical protein
MLILIEKICIFEHLSTMKQCKGIKPMLHGETTALDTWSRFNKWITAEKMDYNFNKGVKPIQFKKLIELLFQRRFYADQFFIFNYFFFNAHRSIH